VVFHFKQVATSEAQA
jgi:hypothetical protein